MAGGTLDKEKNVDLNVKYISADETSTFPITVWNAQPKKKIKVYDVVFGIQNKEANTTARAFLEVKKKGSWQDFITVGQVGKGFDRAIHNFGGRLNIENGGKINLRFIGNSTKYEIYVTVLGREE